MLGSPFKGLVCCQTIINSSQKDCIKKSLEKYNSKTKDDQIDYDEHMKSADWAGA